MVGARDVTWEGKESLLQEPLCVDDRLRVVAGAAGSPLGCFVYLDVQGDIGVSCDPVAVEGVVRVQKVGHPPNRVSQA